METLSCRDCLYRKPDERPEYKDAGHCHRYPPVVVETVAFDGSGMNHYSQHRPWMAADDWCGEWVTSSTIMPPRLANSAQS